MSAKRQGLLEHSCDDMTHIQREIKHDDGDEQFADRSHDADSVCNVGSCAV